MQRLIAVMAFWGAASGLCAHAAPAEPSRVGFNTTSSEYCLNALIGFPDSPRERYEFFEFVGRLNEGATPAFEAAIAEYSGGGVEPGRPVKAVFEDIVNPVLRQGLPQRVVANISELMSFDSTCAGYIDGQRQSLVAIDPTVESRVVTDDIVANALFVRTILVDSLYALSAHDDPANRALISEFEIASQKLESDNYVEAFSEEIDDITAALLSDYGAKREQVVAFAKDGASTSTIRNDDALRRSLNESSRSAGYDRLGQFFARWLLGAG